MLQHLFMFLRLIMTTFHMCQNPLVCTTRPARGCRKSCHTTSNVVLCFGAILIKSRSSQLWGPQVSRAVLFSMSTKQTIWGQLPLIYLREIFNTADKHSNRFFCVCVCGPEATLLLALFVLHTTREVIWTIKITVQF